jgi:hypothetical protein
MYRLSACFLMVGWLAVTQLACISKHVVDTKTKTEQQTQRFFKSDYSAVAGLYPSLTLEKRKTDDLGVHVKHLGEYSEKLAQCLASVGAPAWDPDNPRHIFLFELSNESEELRKFTPYMDFGSKGLDKKSSLAMIGPDSNDMCSVVLEHLPVTQVEVVSGNKQVLQCSAALGGGVESFVHNTKGGEQGPTSFDLYPKQQRRGVLIATQPENPDFIVDTADSVAGDFVLYVHATNTDLASKMLTIPYSFSRIKTEARIPWDRITTRRYQVKEIQKVFNLLWVLPFASGDPYEERLPGMVGEPTIEEVRVKQ